MAVPNFGIRIEIAIEIDFQIMGQRPISISISVETRKLR